MPEDKQPVRKPAVDKGWHGTRSGAGGAAGTGSRPRVLLTLLIGLFLALATFAVAWVFFIHAAPPEPYFLTINVGDYNVARYPVVPFARQDGERLARHFANNRNAESKTKDLLVKELDNLAGHSGRPIVVHITALALVRDNKVYLLPVDADPDDESTWLPLTRVLEAVGRCPEPKLLILDLAHPLADPRLGVLDDRVAERVEDQLKKNTPSFFVLCPCSAGQMSLTSEMLQAGVLAYYLDKGLQGAAAVDRQQTGRTDEAITVSDLYAYVQLRVNHWAHLNRQQARQPVLFGQGRDFPLVTLQSRSPLKDFKTEARAYPKALKDGWESLDSWKPLGLAPAKLRELETEMLRQEKRWQDGADVDEVRLANAIRAAKTVIENFQGPPLSSLFLGTAAVPAKRDARLVRVMRTALDDVLAAEKPEVQAKIGEALKKKLDERKDVDYAQVVWAVMEALSQSNKLYESQVRLALAVLPKLPEGNPPLADAGGTLGFVEAIYLQRLADYADRLKVSGYLWRPGAVQHLFKTMRAREAVLAALGQDPSLLPWVRPQFEKADEERRSAEKKLLWGLPSSWRDADTLFVDAEDKYDQANRLLANLGSYRHTWDEATLSLPSLVPLLTDWPEYDAEALAAWHKAKALTTSVGKALSDETAFFVRGSQLENQRHELEEHLQTLKSMLHERIDRVAKRGGPETLEQVLCLRRSAALLAQERAALDARAAELAKTLQDATERADEEGKVATLPALPRPHSPWNAVQRANVRTRLACALFDLPPAEFSDIAQLDQLDALETRLQKSLMAQEKIRARSTLDVAHVPPWRDFTSWLGGRYKMERELWTADDSKERPAIGAFYRSFELRLAHLGR